MPAPSRWALLSAFLFAFGAGSLAAQHDWRLSDTLGERSLRTIDLPSFEWDGAPEPLRPRLGIYLREVPADTVRSAGFGDDRRGFQIWHIMPHWSADEGGLYIGDILLAMNGKPIGDSSAYGEEFVNLAVREMRPGDTLRFQVLRGGAVREMRVPLRTGTYVAMRYDSRLDALGPIRQGTWFQDVLAQAGLLEWARTIQRQMRVVADQDFCTVPFAGRPNPWRLSDVTYLHRNPTRVGVLSRSILHEIWESPGTRSPLRTALRTAFRHLDITSAGRATEHIPATRAGITEAMGAVQSALTRAYAPIARDLEPTRTALAGLLDMGSDWEAGLDTIADPIRRRSIRNAQEKKLADLFAKADAVKMPELARASDMAAAMADSAWLAELEAMYREGGATRRRMVSGVEGEVLDYWETPEGPCVVGGRGTNRYTGSFRFIFDAGGDDIYELPLPAAGTFRCVADLAGDDIYRNDGPGQGTGLGCLDLLVDAAGNDIYRGVRYAQGAGVLGAGILADLAGDDHYTAHWCSQGAGFLGVGILYDAAGSDSYTADLYAQGFGYVRGFGAIMEGGGNDSYRAGWKYPDSRVPNRAHLAMSQGFGYGMRPWSTGIGADGGIGVLSDLAGDDLYASDFFSQGGSYWYALGILHDARGADRYTAGQYSQGSGIHLSFGALLDDAGDDMYDAYAGLEQGNAHDWSAGCLEDWDGNDTYRGSTSSQGSALNVSFAWLLDARGDDQYFARLSDTVHSQGGGNINRTRKGGALGLLIDLGSGDDYYVEPRALPGTPLVKGNGILYDDGIPRKAGER